MFVAERTEPNKASPTTPVSALVFIIFFNILDSYINLVSRLLAPLRKFYLAELPLGNDVTLHPCVRFIDLLSRQAYAVITGDRDVNVGAELRYGVLKSTSAKLSERIDLILSALEILPLEIPADREYALLRHRLARQVTLIGPNDLLIAAHAVAHNLTVTTGNVREFSRVPGLRVKNWLESTN